MPYTYKSLALMWLIALGLFGLTGSGTVTGSWLVVLLVVALATPALILRGHDPVGALARSPGRPRIVSDPRVQFPIDAGGIDVHRWEDEGGAPAIAATWPTSRRSRGSRSRRSAA